MKEAHKDTQEEILALLKENNKLLKKMYRHDMIGLWLKIIWFAIIIGLPFALYFYVLQPYFNVLGIDSDVVKKGLEVIPGFKGIESLLPLFGG